MSTETIETDTATALRKNELWHAKRKDAVTAEQGPLALVREIWPVDPSMSLEEAEKEAPAGVTVTRVERRSLDGGTEHGIRYWNKNSQGNQDFEEIESFAYNPGLVVTGSFVRSAAAQDVAYQHSRDNGLTRNKTVPGEVSFSYQGEEYSLLVFVDGDNLVLVFADATTGKEGAEGSYAPGRFVYVQRENDSVTIDFNRAFVPPCGFSNSFNCPIPPRQNRLPFAVNAGERRVRYTPGSKSAAEH